MKYPLLSYMNTEELREIRKTVTSSKDPSDVDFREEIDKLISRMKERSEKSSATG